jgi:hypothetical protein
MSVFPVCKIEIYNTSNTLVRTLTSDDILACNCKDIVTSGVGSFSFTLPALGGLTVINNDIGNNYTAKLFFGYGSNYVHLFSGKILPFTTSVSSNAIRTYEGKSLGEILERRFKYNKRWQAAEADDIAAEVASDLSLTGSLDTDTTAETVTVRTESYFNLMQKISDYWVSAGTQLQKDFYVDKDNVLQWHDRPLRTGANVESFTHGVDFQNYSLKYDILPIKNKVTVYGAAKAPVPLNKDDYTDSLTSWTSVSGTLSLYATSPKAGTNWIVCTHPSLTDYYRTIPRVHLRDINKVSFWDKIYTTGGVGTVDVAQARLHAPDASNSFFTKPGVIDASAPSSTPHWNELALGESAEYDAAENPSGIWEKTGSPNWMNICGVEFLAHESGGAITDLVFSVDKLYFYPERWISTAEDSTSQTAYGIREAEYTDDNLQSEAECQIRSETLLYQQKDRVMRLDFAVAGNTNVLVGDRLTLSLPPDAIVNMDFDVVSVEQQWNMQVGYQTVIHSVGATYATRVLPSMTPLDSVQKQLTQNREFTAELYSRIVR